MGAGFYTSDGTLTIKINQYNGYQELTCAQVLQAIKDTDSYNQNAIGFIGVGTINGEGYEVAPFNILSATELYIRNNADGKSEENYNFICWYGVNPTNTSVRGYQYFKAMYSSSTQKWTFGGYRNRSSANYTYGGNTYRGTNSESLNYTSSFLYIEHTENFGTVYFNGVAPITYTWQSVPSISGKNGILLLSTIQSVYLNNGDPVNNALESYIDFIDDSKVAVLVEQEIDDLTKVTVKYVVPAGTYEYIKLVYKTGSAPTSVTDGTAVDILQANKSVILSGIADGSTYFFKIFTDITESEPYEFTTVRPEGDNFFLIDFSSDGRDTMRYNASKTIHVQADSMYSMRDIDYYAAQGALADPVSPSNPTYTISNGEVTTANDYHYLCWAYNVTANQRIIPANCTLWFEFDAYFLNGEGYLDWRMYNNQAVEVIYWCWDTRYAFSANQWYNCKLEATITNGIITTIKYYVDNNMVEQDTRNIHMLCIDEDNSIPLYFITFQTTKPTKLKNMKIYWE